MHIEGFPFSFPVLESVFDVDSISTRQQSEQKGETIEKLSLMVEKKCGLSDRWSWNRKRFDAMKNNKICC